MRKAIAALLALALVLLAAPAAFGQTLRAEYGFNDTRASSVAGAPEMTDIDDDPAADNVFVTETVDGSSRQVLSFPQGNGLRVSTAGVIPTTSYSIAIRFRFADVSSWRRIIDFQNAVSDTGLYVLSGTLDFYQSATSSEAPITPSAGGDPYHEVLLTRDSAGEVVVYADGEEQVRFTDSSGQAIIHPGQTLAFFKDGGPIRGEESAGAVASIRLYDGPLAAPPPQLGEAVNVDVVKGKVLVGIPAGSGAARAAQKGIRFVPLEEVRQVPVGSFLNTRRGTVRLTSARDTRGTAQSGTFAGGLFQVLQSRKRSARGLTDVVLKGASFKRCGRSRGQASAAISKRAIRRLRSNARGRFRTRGRYSAATVRGTSWTTIDRCDGTLTKVGRGRVAVRDLRRKRTVVVGAGKSYLAGPRR